MKSCIYYCSYLHVDTGSGSHLDTVWKSYTPLHMAEECCEIHPINLTGEWVPSIFHKHSPKDCCMLHMSYHFPWQYYSELDSCIYNYPYKLSTAQNWLYRGTPLPLPTTWWPPYREDWCLCSALWKLRREGVGKPWTLQRASWRIWLSIHWVCEWNQNALWASWISWLLISENHNC